MLITATKFDVEFLREQLLKLIEENESAFTYASDSAMRTGLNTLSDPFPVNRALLKRALEAIWRQGLSEDSQRIHDDVKDQEAYQSYFQLQEIDAIGPEFLRSVCDGAPF